MHATKTCRALALLLAAGLLALIGLPGQPAAVAQPSDGKDEKTNAQAEPGKTDLFGDPLPKGAKARMGTLRWRHGGNVTFVGLTAEGKQVITACTDGFFRVWDRSTGKEIHRFRNGPDGIAGQGQMMVGGAAAGVMMVSPPGIGGSVAMSADGRALAATGFDGVVRLWDPVKARISWKLEKEQRIFGSGLALSRDGKALAIRGNDQVIRLYDGASGKEIRRLGQPPVPGQPQRLFFMGGGAGLLAFMPDGKSLVSAGMEMQNNQFTQLVLFLDAETGKELRRIKAEQNNFGVTGLALAPNGQALAWTTGDGTIRLYDTQSGKEVRKIAQQQPGAYIHSPVFSPDSKLLATRHMNSTAIVLWDVEKGTELRRLGRAPLANAAGQVVFFTGYGGAGGSHTVAFSADGKVLAEASGNTIRMWTVADGKEILPASGHQGGVTQTAVSPDGKVLTSYGADGNIRRWELATGKELGRFSVPAGTASVALSRDGQLAAGSSGNVVRLWDVALGKEIRAIQVPVAQQGFIAVAGFGGGGSGLALSPDSKLVAVRSFDQIVHVFETASGKEVRTLSEQQPNNAANGAVVFIGGGNFGQASPMAISSDGALLAFSGAAAPFAQAGGGVVMNPGQAGNVIRLWGLAPGGQLRKFDAQQRALLALTFTPDCRNLVSANADNTISLWEVLTGRECLNIKFKKDAVPQAPQPAAFRAWTFGQALASSIAISPDGRTLAMGAPDRTILMFDLRNGKELDQLKGHEGAVLNVSFAADGKTLISGSEDTTALVWDASPMVEKSRPVAVELTAQQAVSLWEDLAADSTKAYQAIVTLSAAPKQALALFGERLKPASGVDAKRIAQLVEDLASEKYDVRQKANTELEKLGDLAQPALQKAVGGQTSLEARRRMERLLARLADVQAPPTEKLRAMRAIHVLEQLKAREARQMLQRLAKGAAGDRLTRYADGALKRLAN